MNATVSAADLMDAAKKSQREPYDLEFGMHTLRVTLTPTVVRVDGAKANASPRELEVLAHLLSRRGHVVKRQELINAVWGPSVPPSANLMLKKFISNLRESLVPFELIKTRQVPNGYLWDDSKYQEPVP